MAWAKFPYPDSRYVYTPAALKKAWARLHAGDAEPFPRQPEVVAAWAAFHAGEFEEAARKGLAAGIDGYAAAHKATCIHAVYLEKPGRHKEARLQDVAERCEAQQAQQPTNPAGFYWHAYALGRYGQEIGVIAALGQGIGTKVRASLDKALALAPRHADAHIALGVYHAEVLDKIGSLIGRLTYGASREQSIRHFETALQINSHSAIARIEYANALIMLDRADGASKAETLLAQASALEPHDAMERLDIERARQQLDA